MSLALRVHGGRCLLCLVGFEHRRRDLRPASEKRLGETFKPRSTGAAEVNARVIGGGGGGGGSGGGSSSGGASGGAGDGPGSGDGDGDGDVGDVVVVGGGALDTAS